MLPQQFLKYEYKNVPSFIKVGSFFFLLRNPGVNVVTSMALWDANGTYKTKFAS
jgi:hypothetical protein